MEDGIFPVTLPRQRHPLVVVLCAAIIGIMMDWSVVVAPGLSLPLATIFAFAAFAMSSSRVRWQKTDRPHVAANDLGTIRHRAALLSVLVSITFLFSVWHHVYWRLYAENSIAFVATEESRPICLDLVALESPKIVTRRQSDPLRSLPDQTHSSLNGRAVAIRDGADWQVATGLLTLQVNGQLLDVQPGDRLRVFGRVQRPASTMNPGEFSAFDYQRTKRQLARLSVNYPAAVSRLESGSAMNPRWYPARLREYCRRMLWEYLPAEQAELAAALMLGDRQYLSKERSNAFLHTGTVHLLAISGLHVNILAWMFYLAAKSAIVPRRMALLIVMLVTATYAIMAGARAPVIRAAILVFVYCLQQLVNRDGLSINSLAAAALIVLGVNPTQLFNVGAQLSFLAVASMIWFLPLLTARRPLTPIQRLIARQRSYLEVVVRNRLRALWRIWLASLVIWLIALPLVMNRFHIVSPSALILNLFLWIPLAMALLSGFGVLVFGWLCPPIAEVCSWMSTGALKCMEACVQFTEPQPGSHFWVVGPSTEWVLVFYALLFVGVIAFYSPSKRLVCTAMAYGTLGLGLILPANGESTREIASPLQATFLSVGHGGCVVLEFPDGQTWLYDAGSLGSIDASTDIVSQFLWSRGVQRLDAIVMSHADIDHYNVVPGLLQRFHVDRAIVSRAMFMNEDPALNVLRDSLKASKVKVEMMQAGEPVNPVGKVSLKVLHPSSALEPDNDNSNSLVLQLDYFGKSLLLTGDLEAEGLERVLAGEPIDCDVALAPHHGSHRSRPREFVDWCHPEYVVVSNGVISSKGTGPSAYDECGCVVFETSKDGSVAARIDEQGVSVRPHLVQ